MPEIRVWGRGRTGLWTPDGDVDVPEDYEYLPTGDAPLTRAIKKKIGHERVFIVMEKTHKKYPSQQIGLWAPKSLIDAERERLASLRTEEHKEKLETARERRQERDIASFARKILERFPGCPLAEAESIARHSCEIGSGRVGRSQVAENSVYAAVVAHIRHEHTDYDEWLEQRTQGWMKSRDRQEIRFEARDRVQAKINEVLRQWSVARVTEPDAAADGEGR